MSRPQQLSGTAAVSRALLPLPGFGRGLTAWDAPKLSASRPIVAVLCFVGFVAIWTVYASIAGSGLSLHGDVAEAYVWGREFQLGYNQHPPFWAWIAGLWFMVFPNQNWSFHLLAVLNSALGLLGAWYLLGRLATEWERRASLMLLLLTPFYTFLCFKYNANTIFLSIWPWTLYFLIGSLQTRRAHSAIGLGLMLGIALLSKYYAVILVGTCFAASLVHADRAAWYRSGAPCIAASLCALLFLPHAVWLLHADAPPVVYIWGRTGIGWLRSIGYGAEFLIAVLLYHGLSLLLIVTAASPTHRLHEWLRLRQDPVLVTLVLTPVLLTILFGFLFELKISSNMAVGVFPLLPLLAIRTVRNVDTHRLFLRSRRFVLAVTTGALVASPVIAGVVFASDSDPGAKEPRQELAQFVTKLWHEQTQAPLRIVAGSDPYENAIGFYSPDRPSVFIDFSRRRAPWITPAAIAKDGLLAACVQGDSICADHAAQLPLARVHQFDVTLSHAFRGSSRPPVTFDIYLLPPGH